MNKLEQQRIAKEEKQRAKEEKKRMIEEEKQRKKEEKQREKKCKQEEKKRMIEEKHREQEEKKRMTEGKKQLKDENIPKLNINEINVESIQIFYEISKKRNNDGYNKLREMILYEMFTKKINPDYYDNIQYGNKWKTLNEQLENVIKKLCDSHYTTYKVVHRGGRNYNYDFEISFFDADNLIETIPIEFKYNKDSLTSMPQFFEDYDHKNPCQFPESYTDYYYENYLCKYLETDNKITCTIPDKSTYSSNVSDINYKHPFFRDLYNNRDTNKNMKMKIVDESCDQYLKKYVNYFDGNRITQIMKESQNKTYLLWKKGTFTAIKVDSSEITECNIIQNSVSKKSFHIETIGKFPYNIKVLLNWGNNNGVANPRWKFAFISK